MISTRDSARTSRSYTDVLLAGLAPDGGLYVPAEYPQFSLDELKALKNAPYERIAFEVKKKLVDAAIPDKALQTMVDEAYSPKNFALENGQVVPVCEIKKDVWVQNLSLGPTAAFKDMAMQLLGREMTFELERRNETLAILGATSGDTGSAAEAAFKGMKNISLAMLSPLQGMSEFQRAQMASFSGGNIINVSVRGRFDDCQDLVKKIMSKPEFAKLGAVNSINWGRISSQVPYYFSGYFQVAKKIGDAVDFAVPSGNFGNVLSGYIAQQMGLPIRRLIVSTNENDVLHTLFTTGVYESTPAQITSSPSMDISKASNYERLVFDIFEQDAEETASYMRVFNESKKVDFADYGLSPDVFKKRNFVSGTSAHHNRIDTIRDVYTHAQIVIDPHTADGVYVGMQLKSDVPLICLSTALPVKFEHTIDEALGYIPKRPSRFAHIENQASSNAFSIIDIRSEELEKILKHYGTFMNTFV